MNCCNVFFQILFSRRGILTICTLEWLTLMHCCIMLIQTSLFSKASVTNQTLKWLDTIMYCNIIGEKIVIFLALRHSNLVKLSNFSKFQFLNDQNTSCAKLTSGKWLFLYMLEGIYKWLRFSSP